MRNTKKKQLIIKKRKSICNPNARKNGIVNNSCFTKKTVNLLKNSYNIMNPLNKIISNDEREILREIQQKSSSQCKQDLCLIDKFIKNDRDRSMIKSLLFVPPKPSEWSKDPDKWLTNFDIMKVLNQYEASYPNFTFIGPSPIDYDAKEYDKKCVCQKLCKLDKNLKSYLQENPLVKKIGVVFNLDPHTKSGSHWVSLFIDLEDNFAFYFNSTGQRIPKRINNFTTNVISQCRKMSPLKNIKFHQNTQMEHQKSNTECGMYCLYFIITMLLRQKDIDYNKTRGGQKMTAQDAIKYFKGSNGRIADKMVFKKRNEYFR